MVSENVIINDVNIAPGSYRNFSGIKNDFNKAGNRQFSVFLPADTAAVLEDQGWYIKHKPSKRDPELINNQLDIAVAFDKYPPMIKLVSYDGATSYLNEENVGILDSVDIQKADMEIRPYNWDVNGKTGTKAYLKELTVTARPPRRALSGRMNSDEDEPF